MIKGYLELFTEEDLHRLNEAVFDVLKNVGLWIQCDELLDALGRFGANIDKVLHVAKIPPSMVEEIIKEQRKSPWKPEREVRSPTGRYKVGVGLQVAPFYYDFDKKERRPGNREDLIQMIHFGDALEEELPVSQALIMTELDPRIESIEALSLLIQHTSRPGTVYPYFSEQFPYIARIGELYAEDKIRFLSGGIFMTSPLRMCNRAARFMMKKVEYGLSCGVGTMPISGASAPVTAAGNIIVGACEILGGWAALKSIKPDAVLRGSVCSGVLDMRTGKPSFSAPEAMLQDIGVCELFRRLYGGHVTVAGGSDYTDAKLPGLQAAYEKTFKAMAIAAFTGTHVRMGQGLLDSGKLFSPLQLLMDQDLGEGLWKFSRGIKVNDETIGQNVIREVETGRNATYLNRPHTLRNFRRALWSSNLLDKTAWESNGKEIARDREMLEKANEEFKNILSQYTPPAVEKSVVRAIDKVVTEAKKELVLRYA